MLLGFGACSGEIGDQAKSNQLTLECVAIARPIGKQDATSVAALRNAVETGPLYKAVAVQFAPTECRVRSEDGTTGLEYRFRDGSKVHVSREASPGLDLDQRAVRQCFDEGFARRCSANPSSRFRRQLSVLFDDARTHRRADSIAASEGRLLLLSPELETTVDCIKNKVG